MAAKKPRSSGKRTAGESLNFTLSQFGAKAQVVGDRAKAAVKRAEDEVVALRHHAAQSALHWIMDHEDRVKAFRGWVKGTPAESAVNTLFQRIEAEAKPAKAPRKPAAQTARRPASKKAATAKRAK
ncbi:MAG TPA: hypothetical protein VLI06_12295 [Solimonas sp.]|nr:hypothetical protein [Solimonas sp.]